ncbi:MAG: 3-oxoacyl-[acyl-carrier-protein] reductase [Ruminococcaceae bacterium]|nr:3-oxoacyl-[acyl-carrier-protein] reductase [Oscillospiraceae bacterium]
MIDLKGKTAIVTGAGKGIGKAIALKLASFGANVVVNIASSTDADETAKQIEGFGVEALVYRCDVRNPEDVNEMVKTTIEKFGSVDILVNNAGITRDNLIMRMDEKDFDDVIAINLKGAFNCIKAVTRPMMKQRSGVIVNISSVVGVMGNAGQANYCASKAGLIGLTKSTARELSSRGIRANAIAPGFIESAMTDKLSDEIKEQYFKSIPLARFGKAEDVANAVAFLASDMASYITGQIINVDGGLLM